VEAKPRQIVHHLNSNNVDVFQEWFRGLPKPAAARILVKIDRAKAGNLGDSRSVGGGVSEMEIDFGNGYRIYFGQEGDSLVLLTGGTKDSQARDIKFAKSLWEERSHEKSKH
jgi:putative addiction module killer protein